MASPAPTRISKKEAAERLGCSTKKIDRLRTAGELVAVKSSREQLKQTEWIKRTVDATVDGWRHSWPPCLRYDPPKRRVACRDACPPRRCSGVLPPDGAYS